MREKYVKEKNNSIGITLGDPTGIGPEVTFKALDRLKEVSAIVIGEKSVIDEAKKRYCSRWDGEVVSINKKGISYDKREAGYIAYQAILKGYELIKTGKIKALVTAPVCKSSINLINPSFSGHTELLALLAGVKKFAMMVMGEEIRVTLVTTHIPIKEVALKLKKDEIVDKIKLTFDFLRDKFHIKEPKIGVCALNPHAGEEIFGNEEKRIIIPAIEEVKKLGVCAQGPYPADTLFTMDKKFDGIVAMYHDQGLIPLKLKEFGRGVNITLGLPFIRTSPDHGTAFDIAGKGIADPNSMIRAIKLASKLSQNGRA